MIVNGDAIKEDPRGFLASDDFSLEEICCELDVPSIWPLVQASRNHVKSYADKYYYGFKQGLSDDEIICYTKAIYKNIRQIFDSFRPQLIITPNFVGLQHIMFNLYARKRGVEMVGLIDSKISGVTSFTLSYHGDRGRFFERLDELEAGACSENWDKAKAYVRQARTKVPGPLHRVNWDTGSNGSLRAAGLRRNRGGGSGRRRRSRSVRSAPTRGPGRPSARHGL